MMVFAPIKGSFLNSFVFLFFETRGFLNRLEFANEFYNIKLFHDIQQITVLINSLNNQ